MAEKIRGITIELGGDASGLEQALKGVNKEVKNTQSQLKDVERLLKLDPKNTELLAQKQKLLANQIENTNKKLNTLKDVQKDMDKNGVDKNSEQYMALQREIISTETEVKNLKKASQDTANAMNGVVRAAESLSKGAQKVANATRGISTAAGGALVALGGIAVKSAKNADELNTLAKQTGFSVEELQKFQYAADLVDVSMSDITGSASKLKKAVASDSKELAKLGVKTKNADGSFRDISDIWYDTLEALGGIVLTSAPGALGDGHLVLVHITHDGIGVGHLGDGTQALAAVPVNDFAHRAGRMVGCRQILQVTEQRVAVGGIGDDGRTIGTGILAHEQVGAGVGYAPSGEGQQGNR